MGDIVNTYWAENVGELMDAGIIFLDTLNDAIYYSVQNKKLLLIYFHNELQNNENKFINMLRNENNNGLFKMDFCIFASNSSNEYLLQEFKAFCGADGDFMGSKVSNKLFTFKIYENSMEHLSTINIMEVPQTDILYELYLVHDSFQEALQKQNDHMVDECARQYLYNPNWKDISNIFAHISIQQAIEISMNEPLPHLRKLLILYMYKEESQLTQKFNTFLRNGVLKKYSRIFIPIFWNISDSTYHNALQTTCDRYFDEDILKATVTSKEGGVFFFIPDDCTMKSSPKIFTTITSSDDYYFDNLSDTLEHMFTYFQDTNNITDLYELESIDKVTQSFGYCLNDVQINDHCSLHDATEMCLQIPRKMLLLYFHTSTTSQLPEKLLSLKNIVIQEKTILLPWDLSNPIINEKLIIALERSFGLKKIEMMLKSKRSALFMFVPVGKTVILYSVLEESASKSSIERTYKEAYKFFMLESELAEKFNYDCGPVSYQQIMYQQLGDRDFDCFQLEKDEGDRLKEKVAFAYYGPPAGEIRYNDTQNKQIEKAFKKIKEVAANYGENSNMLYISFMRICITPLPDEKHKKFLEDNNYEPYLDFGVVPFFGIRKCFDCPKNGSECRIYIDHTGRTYEDWEDFLENNKFPKVMIIAPKHGIYTCDYRNCVQLEICPSPACGIGPAILRGVDIGASILGGVAGAVGLVTTTVIAVPFLPIVAIGTGLGVGVYSIVRSSMLLADRGKYGESLSLGSSEARGAYLNILAGSLGFTGAGASFALSYVARTGATVGMATKAVVNGITIANITASGAAIGNSAYDIISQWSEDGSPNTLALVQLTSSILFFGHAVYSAQSANTIINRAQSTSITEILDSLSSNRQRKTVTRLINTTAQQTGNVQTANAQVIKYIRNLDNVQEVVAVLTRNTKLLSQNGVKYSVENGQVVFNGVEMNVNEFGNLSRIQRTEIASNIPASDMRPTTPVRTTNSNISSLTNNVRVMEMVGSSVRVLLDPNLGLMEKIKSLLENFSPYIQQELTIILQRFLQKIGMDNRKLYLSFERLYPSSQMPAEVLRMILNFYRLDGVQAFVPENAKQPINNAIKIIEQAIIYSSYSMNTLMIKLIRFCSKWVLQEILERSTDTSPISPPSQRTITLCAKCKGKFYK